MVIPPTDVEMVQDFPSRKKGKFPKELWSAFSEEFRNLRTRIQGAIREDQKVLLVTSSVAREGKSTVATNLARSLSLSGWRVLLVDGDMRRPDLHHLFGTEQAGGVSEVAQGRRGLEEAVAATDVANLDILTAGSRASAPAELIDSPGFRAALKRATALYDCVVIDGPPLISITDASLLARYADGILMVVGGLSTPRAAVKLALDQVRDRPVLGVVLNGISTPKRYGYYY